MLLGNHVLTLNSPLLCSHYGRHAWIKGRALARALEDKAEAAFSAALGSICSLEEVRKEATASAEHQRGLDRAKACSTVWDAARYGVPIQRLRELMEEKLEATKGTRCLCGAVI